MQCPHCDEVTHVLETRTKQEFLVVRRHKCSNGHVSKTYQILESVFLKHKRYILESHKSALRGIERRRSGYEKQQEIIKMLQRGEKWELIQFVLKVSESTVARINRKLIEQENA